MSSFCFMRIFFAILFIGLQISFCWGQKYALIDREYKLPILYTDSVTINQVSSNYFPVRVTDLDSLIANLSFLKNEFTGIQRAKFKSYKMSSGNTNVIVNTVPKAYGDSYEIFLTTSAEIVKAEYLLRDSRVLNKKAIKKLEQFIGYVTSDKSLVIHEFKEYKPAIFDATIFIPSK